MTTRMSDEIEEFVERKRRLCEAWEAATQHDVGMSVQSQSAGDDLMRWTHDAVVLLSRLKLEGTER